MRARRFRASCGDLLQIARGKASRGDVPAGLRSDTEQSVDESSLTYYVALPKPTDLPFSDRVHRLVTFDRAPRFFGRSKPQARGDSLFNETVILFQDIVEVIEAVRLDGGSNAEFTAR